MSELGNHKWTRSDKASLLMILGGVVFVGSFATDADWTLVGAVVLGVGLLLHYTTPKGRRP